MSFVHLHNHTHYSLQDGFATPAEYIDLAEQLGQPAIAMTDNGGLYGAVEFFKAAKKRPVKPILGAELYLAPRTRFDMAPDLDKKRYNLVALVQNAEGYQNLCSLLTYAQLEGFYYKPRIDMELLQKYSSGLIWLAGGPYGALAQQLANGDEEGALAQLERLRGVLPADSLYLELLHRPERNSVMALNTKLIDFGRRHGLPLVGTSDARYAKLDDAQAHDIIVAIANGSRISDPGRISFLEENLSPRSTAEMQEAFAHVPEAVTNTVKIAESIDFSIKTGAIFLPDFPLPDGFGDYEEYIRTLCYRAVPARYGVPLTDSQINTLVHKAADDLPKKVTDMSLQEIQDFMATHIGADQQAILGSLTPEQRVVIDRLEYELFVIHHMGFDSYFLCVADYIDFARKRGIAVGPGRGSAAGAIVAFLLGITNIDPFKYGLLFERFLNPGRVSMPDIDTDFADDRRDEVIDYVSEKYGHDKVAHIGTFGTLAARASLKDAGRAYDIPFAKMNEVAALINMGQSLDEAEAADEMKKLLEADSQMRTVYDIAKKLEGRVRQTGVHACGIVIAPRPLQEVTVVQHPPKSDNVMVTQYESKSLEDMGFFKMDFLGLRNLSVITGTLKLLKERHNIEINIDDIPLDEVKAYQLVSRGLTVGVFQFESPGMTRFLKEMRPTEINDFIAMGALYRPGPMQFIPDYIRRKHGKEEVKYHLPILENVLKETYGIMVYQEQILELARIFAGFSLGEADLLRRAVGKKIKEELEAVRGKFIEGATAMGNKASDAIYIFDDVIMPFARYGFNKSHAACYAIISYQTSYLKALYPTEFFCALLQSDADDTDRVVIDIDEARSMGITVLPPDVNESGQTFTVVGDSTIRFGLSAIKQFGENAAAHIVQVRQQGGPFASFEDFLLRVGSGFITKKSLEALGSSGALDSLIEQGQLAANMATITKFVSEAGKQEVISEQADIFSLMDDASSKPQLRLEPAAPLSDVAKLQKQKEYLGLFVSAHPLDGLLPYWQQRMRLVEQLPTMAEGKKVKVAGMMEKVKKIITKSGKSMAYFTIVDPTGAVEATLMPKAYEQYATLLDGDNVCIIDAKVEHRAGRLQLIVETMKVENLAGIVERAKSVGQYDPTIKARIALAAPLDNDLELNFSEDLSAAALDAAAAKVASSGVSAAPADTAATTNGPEPTADELNAALAEPAAAVPTAVPAAVEDADGDVLPADDAPQATALQEDPVAPTTSLLPVRITVPASATREQLVAFKEALTALADPAGTPVVLVVHGVEKPTGVSAVLADADVQRLHALLGA